MTGHPWTRTEKWYLAAVVVMGYALLPAYMVNTGVYTNWPAVSDPEGIFRLFLGTNVLGIWDELFFICTVFVLLRRHLPLAQANVLQAVLFTSFLWELGFHAWAPVFIFPFALLQALIFTRDEVTVLHRGRPPALRLRPVPGPASCPQPRLDRHLHLLTTAGRRPPAGHSAAVSAGGSYPGPLPRRRRHGRRGHRACSARTRTSTYRDEKWVRTSVPAPAVDASAPACPAVRCRY